MIEPIPANPNWPRYSSFALPPYRFVQGRTPHPRRDPKGHSYGKPEPLLPAFPPERWRDSEWYRYGVDLYNFAYWWECHEIFEGLWDAAGRHTEQGQFFQALIQIAAASIKRFLGLPRAAERLKERGLERLRKVPLRYMGMDVARFTDETRAYFEGRRDSPARDLPGRPREDRLAR
jgi:hypothetical protein